MELKSDDLFFYKTFLWKLKDQRGDQRTKTREDKRMKRHEC